MSDHDEDKVNRLPFWLVGGAAGLAAAATVFFSVWGWETGRIPGAGKAAAASAASAPAAEGSATAAASAASEPAKHAEASAPAVAASAAASATTASTAAPAAAATSAASAATPAAAASAPAAAAAVDGDTAKVTVENGVVKFYFATGKADVAPNSVEALKDVLAGVKAGKKAIVSGYNDSTGNAAANEELAKNRALAVRSALLGFGVPESQIELRKPANTEAGQGNNAEARRVEVVLE